MKAIKQRRNPVMFCLRMCVYCQVQSGTGQVPRGPTKSALIERGLFVDAFQLDKDWTESRLYNELSALLSDSGVTISAILFRIRY